MDSRPNYRYDQLNVEGQARHGSKRDWVYSRPFILGAGGILLLVFLVSGQLALNPDIRPRLPYGSNQQLAAQATGTSPAHNEASDGRKIRILHLIDKPTMESTMDRWFMRSQQEFQMATDLVADAPLWGRGFEDWDGSATITANIARKFGSPTYFDAVLAYYNGDQDNHLGIDPAPRFLQIAELSRHGVVIIDRPHEMRDRRRVPMYDLANVSLVIAPYPQELLEYRDYGKQALLVHQPHPVEPRLFEHDVEQPRSIDVMLAGSLEGPMYPLRHRLGNLIKEGTLPGYIRPHPGYPDILTAEERKQFGINATTMEKQLTDFSNDLGNSKICFVTASRWQYSIQKYGEAAAAGCMMIGTLPLDRKDEFKKHVVEISYNMSTADLWNTVNHWLHVDAPGRLERARRAQNWFLSKYSGRNFVEDVVSWIKLVQSGRRGLLLPHQWDFQPDPLPLNG